MATRFRWPSSSTARPRSTAPTHDSPAGASPGRRIRTTRSGASATRTRPIRTATSSISSQRSKRMLHIGTSGWSYPSWRGGFYPEGADPKTFLSFYSQQFDTVELNTTGYRLPSEDQFRRWAEQVPDGFTFAVKMPLTRLDRVGTFVERATALGDRLGPLRITVH